MNKSIIGMIHLSSIIPVERAIEEVKIYEDCGLQGIIVENYHGSTQD
jgi:predicted TIM-barrel enzyme